MNQLGATETGRKDRIVGVYSQAHNLAIGGNYAQALELYDRIIADVPGLISKTLQINYERALCLKALGKIHEAEQAIRSCLSVRPDDPEFLRFLSEIQSNNEIIDAARESKVKAGPANVKQAEEADRLYSGVKTLLPLVEQADMERALRAISLIEEQIVGRACGRVRNKLLNYLSIVQFARATGSKTVDSIEIGTLFGGSCLMKLLAMRDLGVQGKVVCIDPMSGFYEQTRDPQTGLAVTAEVFFQNLERFGFTKEAVDLRDVKSSDPRATEGLIEGSFAALLIDGDHSYRGVRYDWENYYRFVQPGGIVLFDDYSEPKWPDITVFASELIDFLPDGWRKLGHLGTTLLFSRQPRRTKQVSQEPHDPKPAQTKFLARAGALKKEEDLLAILDPEVISRRSDLINELARYGINHLTKSPALGWNYVLDHVWITEEIECYLSENPRRDLTVLDVGCGRSKFHNFLEKKFGINIIGIDRPQGYCHQAKLENADYYADFLELDVFGENSVDIIFWLSAIEHNEKGKIRQLFRKSMSLLKEGGLFLATFAISKNTHWFEQSEQTNLSAEDSMDVFEGAKVDGNFDEIREKYNKNLLFLRDKYERRYGRFQSSDPDFVVGAVKKIKAASCVEDSSSPTVAGEPTCRYLFMPSNDTHVHFMLPVAEKLGDSQFIVRSDRKENSDFYLRAHQRRFLVYYSGILKIINPSVVILGIDWGPEERQIIQEAKQLGIPTVCIQEGCLDFLDKGVNRLMRADYIFLQGSKMREYLNRRDNLIVTGNPKYDELYETALPENVTVMINCNFTYGIYEDVRDWWVCDVAESCKELGLSFFVSQHPRDKGVFPAEYRVVKSDAFKLKEQWEQASILVSRFSTVIYEALMMGREAVYYNPHGEPFRIFAEDHTGGIKIANSRSELVAALKSAVADLGRNKKRRQEFLLQHCGTLDHDATDRCVRELQAIAGRHASTCPAATGLRDKQDRQNVKENNETLPSVSVIIPCYNGGKYLGQAIESVLRQTFGDFEIIVVDDGSTDNTAEVVRSFSDPRIRYVHKENSGRSAARNTGIRFARGKYITFLDADDIFLRNKLQDQVRFLENHPELGLVAGGIHRIDCNGEIILRENPTSQYLRPEETIVASLFPIHSTLIKRVWIDRAGFFDETLSAGEDWDYHCRLAILACPMYRTADVVGAYRFVRGSKLDRAQAMTRGMLRVVKKTFSNQQLAERFRGLESKALGYTHLKGAVRLYAIGDIENGKYHLGQALKFDPQLREKNHQQVIKLFIYWIGYMQVKSPIAYLDSVFSNLPAEAENMRKLQIPVLRWAAEKYGAQQERLKSAGSFETDRASLEKVLASSNAKLAQFKDKHRGQRCVIIGNGPSLNKMDLSFLKNEITFGMNRIYLLFDKWDFRSTYYVSVNPLVIEQSADQIYRITSPKFLGLNGLPYIQNHRDNIFLQSIRRPSFSTDPRNGLWEGHTVTYVAMQLAYFMGFSEVILIGVDHYFRTKGIPNKEIVSQGTDENHFHPDYFGKGVRWQLPDLEKSEVAYRLAKQAFEAAGRRIIDATVDGHLTIFPKVDYRELFFPAAHPAETCKVGITGELVDTEFEEYFRNKSESIEPLTATTSPKFGPMESAEQQQRYLVSAIVSTYNSEHFLRGCLENLENQTIADRLEIIVVNSGSQQNEESIVKEFQQKYDNIVYIKTEEREGIYTAWNRAVRAARGEFITNANTDDRHCEDALEIMARALQSNPDVALVYGDQICTDTPNGTFASHHATEMAKRPDYSRQRLLFGCCVGSQPMWRGSLHNKIGYFDETLTSAGDWDFWLRISNKYPFKHIPEFLGLYYYNEHGIEHGRKIHSLYERYIVGRQYGNPYISVIPLYRSKDNPLVSVITPAYNAAEHIAEAIESVLIQNYRNFELIIVDDGSTDNTKDIVVGFKDDKIKYFHKQNAGPSSARNFAIRQARGQYIMPLDSDDMMTPDFIARHLQEFEKHPEADLVYSDVLLIDTNSNPIRVMKKPEYQDRRHMVRDLLRAGHPIIPFRLGIRKSVFDKIGLYDEKLMVAEDYDMMRRFVKHGLKVHHLSGALHMRRMSSDSLSRNFSLENAKFHFDVVKRFTDTFRYDELFPDVAWERIPAEHRQSHAKCLAAVTFLGIGQAYVRSNSVNYARTAFELACSELNNCLEMDPGNMRLRDLLKKSEFAKSRCSEPAVQAAC